MHPCLILLNGISARFRARLSTSQPLHSPASILAGCHESPHL